MQTTFLLGRAQSGKSRYILDKVKVVIQKRPEQMAYVVVPEQAALLTEQNILEHSGQRGYLNARVISMEKLIRLLFEEMGGRDQEMVDRHGLALRLYASYLKAKQEFHVLGGENQEYDLFLQMADAIIQLKNEQVLPQQLEEIAEEVPLELLKAKLLDMAKLYQMGEAAAMQTFDVSKMTQYVLENLQDSPFFENAHIFIDQYDSFSQLECNLIAQMAKQAKSLWIALTYESAREPDAQLFTMGAELKQKLQRTLEKSGVPYAERTLHFPIVNPTMAHLEKNLYAYPYQTRDLAQPDIAILEAGSRNHEVEQVALAIKGLIGQGTSPQKIGILCPEYEQYAPILENVFEEQEIPLYLGRKRRLSQCFVSEFLLSALDIAAAKNPGIFLYMKHLKSGMLPLSPEQVCSLEQYVKKYGIRGYEMAKELTRGEEEEREQAEQIRQIAFAPLFEFVKQARSGQTIAGLLDYFRQIHGEETLQTYIEKLRQMGAFEQAIFFEQVYEKTVEVLERVQKMTEGMELSVKDLRAVVSCGMDGVQVSTIPSLACQVSAGDIMQAILGQLEYLFILGLNDGILPAGQKTQGIFSVQELEMLTQQHIGIGQIEREKVEKLSLYRAMSSVEKQLFLSYVGGEQLDLGGPSWLIGRIQNLFCGNIPVSRSLLRLGLDRGYRALAGEIRQYLDFGEMAPDLPALLGAYERAEQTKGITNKLLEAAQEKNQPISLKKSQARDLYGYETTSISMLEKYRSCPYRHFLTYGIRAKREKELAEEGADLGSLVHEVMDQLTRYAKKEAGELGKLTDQQIDAFVDSYLEEKRETHNYGYFNASKKNGMLLHTVAQMVKQSAQAAKNQVQQVHVSASEQHMLSSKGDFFTVALEDGTVIRLKGIIDRVDQIQWEDREYIRIVDYKTSQQDFDFTRFCHGLALQLVVYLKFAVEQYQKATRSTVLPFGAFYFTVKGSYTDQEDGIEEAIQKEYRMNGFMLSEPLLLLSTEQMQEPGALSSINMQIKKDLTVASRYAKRVFTGEQMEKLFLLARQIVQSTVKCIYEGKLEIRPVQEAPDRTSCTFCEFRSICKFDVCYEGNDFDMLEPVDQAQMLGEMNEEVQSHQAATEGE